MPEDSLKEMVPLGLWAAIGKSYVLPWPYAERAWGFLVGLIPLPFRLLEHVNDRGYLLYFAAAFLVGVAMALETDDGWGTRLGAVLTILLAAALGPFAAYYCALLIAFGVLVLAYAWWVLLVTAGWVLLWFVYTLLVLRAFYLGDAKQIPFGLANYLLYTAAYMGWVLVPLAGGIGFSALEFFHDRYRDWRRVERHRFPSPEVPARVIEKPVPAPPPPPDRFLLDDDPATPQASRRNEPPLRPRPVEPEPPPYLIVDLPVESTGEEFATPASS